MLVAKWLRNRRAGPACAAALLALPLAVAAAGFKLSDIPAREASILADRDSRAYYLYVAEASADGRNGGVLVYRSKDLVNWDGPSAAFQAPDGSWANPAQGVRWPRVYAYRGRYYLFATLSNSAAIIARPPESWRVNTMQGTQIFACDSPRGPFLAAPNGANRPHTPPDFVSLGGALWVEGDLTYLAYVHDWTQLVDANIEAVRLKADLSASVEDAFYLFKASDASWLPRQTAASREPRYYPAGPPYLYRTRKGSLVAVWSSPKGGKPAVTVARSETARIRGPWKQTGSVLAENAELGSLFEAFDGRLMTIVNQAGGQPRAKLVELEDAGDTLRIKSAVRKGRNVR
jgi:hypothetical protein